MIEPNRNPQHREWPAPPRDCIDETDLIAKFGGSKMLAKAVLDSVYSYRVGVLGALYHCNGIEVRGEWLYLDGARLLYPFISQQELNDCCFRSGRGVEVRQSHITSIEDSDS